MAARVNDRRDQADLVVVGAGVGGMATALVAALQGLHVVLCESSEQVGGTSATSAGTLWVPGNRLGEQADGNAVQSAAQYLEALIGPDDELGRRQAFLDSGREALDFLQKNSAVQLASSGPHPDYLPGLPGAAVSGRAVGPQPFDGRLLGRDFDRIRPPLPHFMLLGGMMVGKADIQALVRRWHGISNFMHSARLVLRYAADRVRHQRGTRLVMGNALVARLFYSLREAGVDTRFGWTLEDLAVSAGHITGARFRTPAGMRRLWARAGVVLATGGVGHHAQLRRELGAADLAPTSLAAPGVAGVGISAARAAGARLDRHRGEFFWQPVSRAPLRKGSHALFPHLFLDRAKPGLIAVNRRGQRFVDEAASYHHFVEGMLTAGAAPCWLVCDAAFLRRYGLGAVPPAARPSARWITSGYLARATSLDALARQLGVDAAGLQQSVQRHNAAAPSGLDPDFGKGSNLFDRFNGDPDHAPNPCLGPIAQAPYYAVQLWPADAASSTGLAVDRDGQVLAARDDRAIGGLYACGNDAASLMRGHYPGPGTTLGPAVVGAYRIALHAAQQIQPSRTTT
jgi:succinate dehydrogenase/fumarate reductase flavoprotein subunit